MRIRYVLGAVLILYLAYNAVIFAMVASGSTLSFSTILHAPLQAAVLLFRGGMWGQPWDVMVATVGALGWLGVIVFCCIDPRSGPLHRNIGIRPQTGGGEEW